MGEHASPLALDSLAAALPVDLPTSSHVAGCGVCRAKLEALKAERAALMQTPQFSAVLSRLKPAAPERKARWVPALLAMAAALLVLVAIRFSPREDGTILKGQPTVELLKGAVVVSSARVGDRISLAVGGAGQSAVGVFIVDETSDISVLVPSTKLTPGARVPVGSGFEVTPGSFVVVACFGEHPLPMDRLRAGLAARALPDGCVKAKLEVLP